MEKSRSVSTILVFFGVDVTFRDCRGVQPPRTGRLVYSLLIMQIWATCRQEVVKIGRSGVERFVTFLGKHGEFGTT